MEKRRNLHNIDTFGEESIEEASQKLQESLKEWEDLKVNKIKQRE